MASGLYDNHSRGKVGDFLKERVQPGSALSFVSAYFTVYAHSVLKGELDAAASLRFLFGEPAFVRGLDPEKTQSRSYALTGTGLAVRNVLEQSRAAKDCADFLRKDHVEVRSVVKPNFLHGKVYHISHNGQEEALVGSSNFTMSGLGMTHAPNVELNLVVDSKRDLADLKQWFDELWHSEIVQDVKEEVLEYLQQLYVHNAPEFVYYKTLYHIFARFLEEQDQARMLDERTGFYQTEIWEALYEFQKDGVRAAINKILKHNGCILADSVGLGKTYSALAVIKYFELRNERVLVLAPKKLRENWTVYHAQNNSELNPFRKDRFSFTVLSHTDLNRASGKSGDVNLATLDWSNYDLVVIDESHNFRNQSRGQRDEEGNVVRKSRYERLMEDVIQTGVRTKVLLVSATPVNTALTDLRNQVAFLTGGKDAAFAESLSIPSLAALVREGQKVFNDWADTKKNRKPDVRQLMERLPVSFFKLLDELTIARSRKHIGRYYNDQRVGDFPQREKPTAVFSPIDTQDKFVSYDKLNDDIQQYRLALFSPVGYIRSECRAKYPDLFTTRGVVNFNQEDRENSLIGMMKVNFLKRLESSIHSFRSTLERTFNKLGAIVDRLETYEATRSGELDSQEVQLELALDAEDEDLDAFQLGERYKISFADMDTGAWLADLKKDLDQIRTLLGIAEAITPQRDAKLQSLKEIIRAKAANPTLDLDGRPNRKLLVFTAFTDTAKYLYENLRDFCAQELQVNVGLVTGGGDNATTFRPPKLAEPTSYNTILVNFAPIAKHRDKMPSFPQEGGIDVLIATDCISEGQNLQDCDKLVNYDIHWNPVRIVQRFGRIDRLGSRNRSISLVNFWPTDDLNKYINLKNRVEARMALVDLAATNEDNVLGAEALRELISEDLSFRDRQLVRFKDEILDLEELNESVALTDFTLDDYRADLTRYLVKHQARLEQAPPGLYALTYAEGHPAIQPGAIFCFRQTTDARLNERLNPLQPYFLVYVLDGGGVKYSFAQPKQILETLQLTCSGKQVPIEELCTLFERETDTGANMARYDDLLESALGQILSGYRKRVAESLFSGRGTKVPTKTEQITGDDSLELLTWFILKPKAK